jgi:hypothetical protein
MIAPTSSGASLAVVLSFVSLGSLGAGACASSQTNLRRASEDPYVGERVTMLPQPPPMPPARNLDSDPEVMQHRFSFDEAKARKELQKSQPPPAPDQSKVVVDTDKNPPPPPAPSPSVRAAAYRGDAANPQPAAPAATPAPPPPPAPK